MGLLNYLVTAFKLLFSVVFCNFFAGRRTTLRAKSSRNFRSFICGSRWPCRSTQAAQPRQPVITFDTSCCKTQNRVICSSSNDQLRKDFLVSFNCLLHSFAPIAGDQLKSQKPHANGFPSIFPQFFSKCRCKPPAGMAGNRPVFIYYCSRFNHLLVLWFDRRH